jgi:hypothetical protein
VLDGHRALPVATCKATGAALYSQRVKLIEYDRIIGSVDVSFPCLTPFLLRCCSIPMCTGNGSEPSFFLTNGVNASFMAWSVLCCCFVKSCDARHAMSHFLDIPTLGRHPCLFLCCACESCPFCVLDTYPVHNVLAWLVLKHVLASSLIFTFLSEMMIFEHAHIRATSSTKLF